MSLTLLWLLRPRPYQLTVREFANVRIAERELETTGFQPSSMPPQRASGTPLLRTIPKSFPANLTRPATFELLVVRLR